MLFVLIDNQSHGLTKLERVMMKIKSHNWLIFTWHSLCTELWCRNPSNAIPLHLTGNSKEWLNGDTLFLRSSFKTWILGHVTLWRVHWLASQGYDTIWFRFVYHRLNVFSRGKIDGGIHSKSKVALSIYRSKSVLLSSVAAILREKFPDETAQLVWS